MGKTGSLRNIILFFLVVIILLGIGYKYLEYSTIKSISDIQVKADREEISLADQQDKLSNKAYDSFVKLFTEEEASLEANLKQFDDLNGLVNQSLNNENNYLKTLETNKNQYQNLETQSKILFGKKGEFVKRFLSHQGTYYDTEIENVRTSLVDDNLFLNLFAVWKDRALMDDYDGKAQKNPETYYSNNFTDIATLEKYTRSDFKFKDEDKIKEFYPYGYDSLNKFKEYMASYYSVIKDYVGGDEESASFKYSRLQETAINLNIDFEKLFFEGKDKSDERSNKIIAAVTEKSKLIKDFKDGNLGKYPLLPTVQKWKEDLLMCQMYAYKTNYYQSITNKYPDATNFDTLLTQLAEVAPKTDAVDSRFDKSTIKYSSSDKKIKFECLDKEDGKTYTFVINK